MSFFSRMKTKLREASEDLGESIIKLIARVGVNPSDKQLNQVADRSERLAIKVAAAVREELGDLPGVPDVAAEQVAELVQKAAQLLIAGALEGAKTANKD